MKIRSASERNIKRDFNSRNSPRDTYDNDNYDENNIINKINQLRRKKKNKIVKKAHQPFPGPGIRNIK